MEKADIIVDHNSDIDIRGNEQVREGENEDKNNEVETHLEVKNEQTLTLMPKVKGEDEPIEIMKEITVTDVQMQEGGGEVEREIEALPTTMTAADDGEETHVCDHGSENDTEIETHLEANNEQTRMHKGEDEPIEIMKEIVTDVQMQEGGDEVEKETEAMPTTMTATDDGEETHICDHGSEKDTEDLSVVNQPDDKLLQKCEEEPESEIVRKVFNITSSTQFLSHSFDGSDNDRSKEIRQEKEKSFDQSTVGNDQEYRCMKSLVMYSGSESDSEESSSDSESEATKLPRPGSLELSFEDEGKDNVGDDTDDDVDTKRAKNKQKGDDQRLRTRGEVFPEELPPLDYLAISAGEDIKLEPLGRVTGIVDVLVVIQSVDASPALFDDTVLFLENRQPLGLIFETMGTVERPFYTVRFNSNEDIKNKEIHIGDKVMYAPEASNITKYVFIAELKRRKFADASWECDNEPPPEALEYSDDEQERMAKRRIAMSRRKPDRDGDSTEKTKRKKGPGKKNRTTADDKRTVAADVPNRSGLPQGPLNRNPFGDPSEIAGRLTNKCSSSSTTKTAGCPSTKSFNPNPPSTFWNSPQPQTMFGGKPSWREQAAHMRSPLDNSSSQFHSGPPTFQSSLPPVYNTTSPTQASPLSQSPRNQLPHQPSSMTNPFSMPPTRQNSFSMPPTFNTSQPTPHNGFGMPPAFDVRQPPPQRPTTPNPFAMHPTFNANRPPPPLPMMFTPQFSQSQGPASTSVTPATNGHPQLPFAPPFHFHNNNRDMNESR